MPEPEEGFQSTGNLSTPAEGCLQDTIYLKGRLRSIDVLYPPRPSTPPTPWLTARQEGTNIEACSSETLWSSALYLFLRHLWNNFQLPHNHCSLTNEGMVIMSKVSITRKKKLALGCKTQTCITRWVLLLPATVLKDFSCCPDGSSSPQGFRRQSNHGP